MFQFNDLKISRFKNLKSRFFSSIFILPILISAILIGGVLLDSVVMLIGMLAIGESNYLISEIEKSGLLLRKVAIFRIISVFIIFIPCVCFILLRYEKSGILLIFWLCSIVISTDIFAYFGGQIFKGILLCPRISPSKTLSGSISGFIVSLLISSIFLLFLNNAFSISKFFIISALSSIFAQLGDLFESYCKRIANVKDSGTIVVGHGGVLDRLDSFIFSVPLFFTLISVFYES